MSHKVIKHNRVSVKASPRREALSSKHRRIASGFLTQGDFELFLQKLRPASRNPARETLRPYLKFQLVEVEVSA